MAKKSKKKKKTNSGGAESSSASAPATEFLPFEQAYEDGNYAMARRLALAAVEGDHAKRARAVLDVISVDRLPLLVFAACLVLISSIALLGLGH